MSPKIVFLTGAPSADSLDWNDADLLDTFQPTVARFLGLSDHETSLTQASNSSDHISWRLLPLKPQHLATGFSQVNGWYEEYRNAEFFNTQDLSSVLSDSDISQESGHTPISQSAAEDVLSQFYEESFAIHQDVPSSALPVPSQVSTQNSEGRSISCDGSDTFASGSGSWSTAMMPPPMIPRPEIPSAGHMSDLEDLPNAKYLNTIQPQTVTVNLIVGVISILPPRLIKTRRGASVEIVEILVADETKSGFGVNFWLHPTNPGPGELESRKILEALRLQDIILLKNVALSSFRGKVFGQSLRKDMTRVHLLYRNLLDRRDSGGCYSASDLTVGENMHPQVRKTRLVREWVLRFVGGPVRKDTKGHGQQRTGKWEAAKEILPPDTQ